MDEVLVIPWFWSLELKYLKYWLDLKLSTDTDEVWMLEDESY